MCGDTGDRIQLTNTPQKGNKLKRMINRYHKIDQALDFGNIESIRPTPELARVKGMTVALVGCAESITGQSHGDAIDSHDLVCRINYGAHLSGQDSADVGTRTDIACVMPSLIRGFKDSPICAIRANVSVKEWLRHWCYVDMLPDRMVIPCTGNIIALDLLVSGCEMLSVYGMDFFLTGDRMTTQQGGRLHWYTTRSNYHDYEQDRLCFQRILNEFEGRVYVDQVCRDALTSTFGIEPRSEPHKP